MDHAGISDGRCGALRGGSGGGILLLIQLSREQDDWQPEEGQADLSMVSWRVWCCFLACACQKSDENGIGTCLRGYLR